MSSKRGAGVLTDRTNRQMPAQGKKTGGSSSVKKKKAPSSSSSTPPLSPASAASVRLVRKKQLAEAHRLRLAQLRAREQAELEHARQAAAAVERAAQRRHEKQQASLHSHLARLGERPPFRPSSPSSRAGPGLPARVAIEVFREKDAYPLYASSSLQHAENFARVSAPGSREASPRRQGGSGSGSGRGRRGRRGERGRRSTSKSASPLPPPPPSIQQQLQQSAPRPATAAPSAASTASSHPSSSRSKSVSRKPVRASTSPPTRQPPSSARRASLSTAAQKVFRPSSATTRRPTSAALSGRSNGPASKPSHTRSHSSLSTHSRPPTSARGGKPALSKNKPLNPAAEQKEEDDEEEEESEEEVAARLLREQIRSMRLEVNRVESECAEQEEGLSVVARSWCAAKDRLRHLESLSSSAESEALAAQEAMRKEVAVYQERIVKILHRNKEQIEEAREAHVEKQAHQKRDEAALLAAELEEVKQLEAEIARRKEQHLQEVSAIQSRRKQTLTSAAEQLAAESALRIHALDQKYSKEEQQLLSKLRLGVAGAGRQQDRLVSNLTKQHEQAMEAGKEHAMCAVESSEVHLNFLRSQLEQSRATLQEAQRKKDAHKETLAERTERLEQLRQSEVHMNLELDEALRTREELEHTHATLLLLTDRCARWQGGVEHLLTLHTTCTQERDRLRQDFMHLIDTLQKKNEELREKVEGEAKEHMEKLQKQEEEKAQAQGQAQAQSHQPQHMQHPSQTSSQQASMPSHASSSSTPASLASSHHSAARPPVHPGMAMMHASPGAFAGSAFPPAHPSAAHPPMAGLNALAFPPLQPHQFMQAVHPHQLPLNVQLQPQPIPFSLPSDGTLSDGRSCTSSCSQLEGSSESVCSHSSCSERSQRLRTPSPSSSRSHSRTPSPSRSSASSYCSACSSPHSHCPSGSVSCSCSPSERSGPLDSYRSMPSLPDEEQEEEEEEGTPPGEDLTRSIIAEEHSDSRAGDSFEEEAE